MELQRSSKKNKKYQVSFMNPETNRRKTIHFGASAYDDYTTPPHDEAKKARYLERHAEREDWGNIYTPGALSRWLLWREPTLNKSIKATEKQFGIKIVKAF